ncbi:hypothetical protein E3V39_13065 [Gammaproteobacteria bacterium LSUCC0112]|nr:hypothetical protein E3V39_13065 [Gammaproteobacteria bacterium LSUCC0112]
MSIHIQEEATLGLTNEFGVTAAAPATQEKGRTTSSESALQTSSPDPFDPAQFAANSTVLGGIGVTKEMVTCPVRKPNKQEFVRVHPGVEYQLRAHILELKEERETYLVMPAVAAALPGETRTANLRLTVSRQGAVFLWPVPEPSLDGRETSWGTSARAAAISGETKWVRIVANMPQGAYDVHSAPGALCTPSWPDKPLRDILAVAFGESFIIRDAGHPVIKRLLGLT